MGSRTKTKDYRILLADDVKLFLEVEKTFFLRSGYQVFTATSGDEVLSVARRQKPDVILLDYEMPGMKGDEICRELKASGDTRHIPVIVVSQHYSRDILQKCIQAGSEDYLTKPLDQSLILRRVAEILNVSDRRHLRATVVVTVDRGTTRKQFIGKAQNISESGIYLETSQPLEVGNVFQLSFLLPKLEERVSGRGEVVRVEQKDTSGEYGAGIRFVEIPEVSISHIRKFVELHVS
jgi:uncharacterized protein (TIGR02266 family)